MLLNNDFKEVESDADICIVNTCTVTQTSDSKSRKMLRSLAKKNPNALIVVMGCYSQLNSEEVKSIEDKIKTKYQMSESNVLE